MEELEHRIGELGFAAWRALPPVRFDRWEADRRALAQDGHDVRAGMVADPAALLPGAAALLVLLTAYAPWRDWPEGSLWVHPHYPAQHRAGQAALRLVEWMRESGYRAVNAHQLPQRHAAFAAGFGHSGWNGLLIHPVFGSRICFHTILTDMPLPVSPPAEGDMRGCMECGACAGACPAGAIAGKSLVYAERCLRHFAPMRAEIPEQVRRLLGMRLIGCDDCQSVCPKNNAIPPPVDPPEELVRSVRLAGLLDWDGEGREQTRALAGWIGSNEARPARLAGAAAMHAGNSGDARYLPALERMKGHPDEKVRRMALWGISRIRAANSVNRPAE